MESLVDFAGLEEAGQDRKGQLRPSRGELELKWLGKGGNESPRVESFPSLKIVKGDLKTCGPGGHLAPAKIQMLSPGGRVSSKKNR